MSSETSKDKNDIELTNDIIKELDREFYSSEHHFGKITYGIQNEILNKLRNIESRYSSQNMHKFRYYNDNNEFNIKPNNNIWTFEFSESWQKKDNNGNDGLIDIASSVHYTNNEYKVVRKMLKDTLYNWLSLMDIPYYIYSKSNIIQWFRSNNWVDPLS